MPEGYCQALRRVCMIVGFWEGLVHEKQGAASQGDTCLWQVYTSRG